MRVTDRMIHEYYRIKLWGLSDALMGLEYADRWSEINRRPLTHLQSRRVIEERIKEITQERETKFQEWMNGQEVELPEDARKVLKKSPLFREKEP